MRRFYLLFIPLILIGCTQAQEDNRKLVVISKFYPNNDYQVWLNKHSDSLRYVSIYDTSDDSIDFYLEQCDGIVLTGGGDMDPDIYGKGVDIDLCSGIDPRRDSLDILLVRTAFENDVPILGVCRGMQVMNVEKGGSLITDLPLQRESYIHKQRIGDMEHDIYVVNGSALHNISGCLATVVNSNHHQAIDDVGDGFEIQAYAPDSVIESIWWSDTASHKYALGVMWHPERLQNINKVSGPVAKSFIDAIQ